MPAYIIVNIEIKDPVRYAEYIKMAPASIAHYGGRYIARGGNTERLEGTWEPKRVVILEFPSFQRARQWWACDEYAEARRLRQSCAVTEMVLVDGFEGF